MSDGEVIYRPSPWQQLFHTARVWELLGAGAQGPGKSRALLMDAMPIIQVEHQRCIDKKHKHRLAWGQSTARILHLRRTRPMLRETIDRAKRTFPRIDPDVHWNEEETTFTFKSGLKYQFGHCKDPDSWQAYESNEYCMAAGEPVVMGDGSLKPIEQVVVGDMVATLAGPRRVIRAFDSGVKPCVEAVVRDQHGIVGTHRFPTTHPVLCASSEQSPGEWSPGSRQGGGRSRPHGWSWQDYESLLCGRRETQVKRASLVAEGIAAAGSCGQPPAWMQLPPLSVRVVLHERTARSAERPGRQPTGCPGSDRLREQSPSISRDGELRPIGERWGQQPSGVGAFRGMDPSGGCSCGGAAYARTGPGTAKGSPERCSSCLGPRGERALLCEAGDQERARRAADAASRTPSDSPPGDPDSIPTNSPGTGWFFPHFYSGESLPRSEAVRTGTAELRYCGQLQTYDLTVEGANHYITSTGLINAQCAIYWDELNQFDEEQYVRINARCRSTDPVLSQKDKDGRYLYLRIRSCSNPTVRLGNPDEGGFQLKDPAWVRRRFVDPEPRGKVIFRKTLEIDGETFFRERLYLPATIDDNPDKAFREHQKTTLSLTMPPHLVKALLYGDWYVSAASHFAEEWDSRIHVIAPFRCPSNWRFFRSGDWGYKSPGVIGWYAMDEDEDIYLIYEFKFRKMLAEVVAGHVQRIEKRLGLWDVRGKCSRITGPLDNQAFREDGRGGRTIAETFAALGVPWVKAAQGTGSRENNATLVAERLRDHQNMTTKPGLMLFSTCRETITILPSIQTDPKNSEAPLEGGDDHAYDQLQYAVAYASGGRAGIPAPRAVAKSYDPFEDPELDPRRPTAPSRGGNHYLDDYA